MTNSPTKTDSIRFRCPHCEVILRGKHSDGGKERRCPKCEKSFRIPQPKSHPKSSSQDAAATPKPKSKPKKQQDELIPVVCGVCQTRMYAGAAQLGSSIECPDCYTQNLVKPPPKGVTKTAPRMGASMNYDLEPERPVEIIKERGQDLLEEADREVVKELEAAPDRPAKPFITGVYSYPFWLQTIPIIIGMTFGWTLLVYAIQFALVLPFILPVVVMLGITVAMPSLVTFQRICVNTSNMDDESDCRPEGGMFGIIDWMFEVVPIGLAMFFAVLPVSIILSMLQPSPEWYLLLPISFYLLFPIVYMSILENDSVMGVYSSAVWGSVARLPGTWMKFYLSTGLLIAGLLGLIAVAAYWRQQLTSEPAITTVIAIRMVLVSCSTIVFTLYFRLLGRVGMIFAEKIMIQDPDSAPVEKAEQFVDSID